MQFLLGQSDLLSSSLLFWGCFPKKRPKTAPILSKLHTGFTGGGTASSNQVLANQMP